MATEHLHPLVRTKFERRFGAPTEARAAQLLRRYKIITQGPRVPAVLGIEVLYRDGGPVLGMRADEPVATA